MVEELDDTEESVTQTGRRGIAFIGSDCRSKISSGRGSQRSEPFVASVDVIQAVDGIEMQFPRADPLVGWYRRATRILGDQSLQGVPETGLGEG